MAAHYPVCSKRNQARVLRNGDDMIFSAPILYDLLLFHMDADANGYAAQPWYNNVPVTWGKIEWLGVDVSTQPDVVEVITVKL